MVKSQDEIGQLVNVAVQYYDDASNMKEIPYKRRNMIGYVSNGANERRIMKHGRKRVKVL